MTKSEQAQLMNNIKVIQKEQGFVTYPLLAIEAEAITGRKIGLYAIKNYTKANGIKIKRGGFNVLEKGEISKSSA